MIHHPFIKGGVFFANLKYKMKRRSLVPFISGPRVARSYFLCDSISAAGTLTQDSLLLLPFHNILCDFRASSIIPDTKNAEDNGKYKNSKQNLIINYYDYFSSCIAISLSIVSGSSSISDQS